MRRTSDKSGPTTLRNFAHFANQAVHSSKVCCASSTTSLPQNVHSKVGRLIYSAQKGGETIVFAQNFCRSIGEISSKPFFDHRKPHTLSCHNFSRQMHSPLLERFLLPQRFKQMLWPPFSSRRDSLYIRRSIRICSSNGRILASSNAASWTIVRYPQITLKAVFTDCS